jgi:hypothetical protein
MRWPWQRPKPDTTEAQAQIDRLREQEPEVARLKRDLQDARRRNHFAQMIVSALRGAS